MATPPHAQTLKLRMAEFQLMPQERWRKDVSGGRRRTRLEGNGGQTCQTLPRSSTRKRLINTYWIRQQQSTESYCGGKASQDGVRKNGIGIHAVTEQMLVSAIE